MREFLRHFFGDWIAAVSGIGSVGFWIVSAALEGTGVNVSVRIGFFIVAAISSWIAAYRIWKREADARKSDANTATEKCTLLESRINALQTANHDRKAALDELGKLMNHGSELFNAGINHESPQRE